MVCNQSSEIQLAKAWQPCWWNKQKKFGRNLLFMSTSMVAKTKTSYYVIAVDQSWALVNQLSGDITARYFTNLAVGSEF